MIVIKLNNEEEYKLEFGFEAAEYKDIVQKMFKMVTGAYLVGDSNIEDEDEATTLGNLLNGTANMLSDLPSICTSAFYAGLLMHENMDKTEAKTLMVTYMKENKLNFYSLYEKIKECMEKDGFFDLTGLNEMAKQITESNEEQPKKQRKTPQDHQKKQTSTK